MKNCPICSARIKGRIDKKFCSTPCKNQHHRLIRRSQATVRQTIDKFLHRNHTILYELLLENNRQKIKVSKVKLQKAGFRFSNYTGSYNNRQGKTYYHVYDYSWMEFSDDKVLVLKKS